MMPMDAMSQPASQGMNPQQQSPDFEAEMAGLAGQLQKRMPPNDWIKFTMAMQNKTPEERANMMQMLGRDYGVAAQDAQADMSRADALRMDTPQGRYAGRVYQAANPLEHIASTMNNMRREKEYQTGRTARGEARAGADELRQKTMADLLRQ